MVGLQAGAPNEVRRVLSGEWPVNVVNRAVKGKSRADLKTNAPAGRAGLLQAGQESKVRMNGKEQSGLAGGRIASQDKKKDAPADKEPRD